MTKLIEARHVGFSIPLMEQRNRRLLQSPTALFWDVYVGRRRRTLKPILRDVSFDVNSGDRIALIGPNGAGKSTLLRLLAGVYRPSSGTLAVRGHSEGIFDVSLGFNQEATGRENIYLRGLRLGMAFSEITERIDDIVAFAEIGEVIDLPISTYSNGMRYRLAIAVSTIVVPDILLLDEWIGAGDAGFRNKAEARIRTMLDTTKALILASHNEALLKQICNRGIVLAVGERVFDGPIDAALAYYRDRISGKTPTTPVAVGST